MRVSQPRYASGPHPGPLPWGEGIRKPFSPREKVAAQRPDEVPPSHEALAPALSPRYAATRQRVLNSQIIIPNSETFSATITATNPPNRSHPDVLEEEPFSRPRER